MVVQRALMTCLNDTVIYRSNFTKAALHRDVDSKVRHSCLLYRACKLLKFVSMVSMFLTISGGKQYVFGPIILIINRN